MRKIYLILSIFFIFNIYYCWAKQKPQKIISLSPYITEIIFNLESADKLIAVTQYCNRPNNAQNKPSIGGIINPNLEKILSLKPDLLLTTKEDQTKDIVKKLTDLDLNVVILEEAESFEDIKTNFMQIAELLGKTNLAKTQLEQITIKLNSLKPNTKQPIFVILENAPLMTISQKSFINDILIYAGFENIVKLQKPRYPVFSREEFLKLNPKFILDLSKENMDVFMRANPYAFLEAVEKLKNEI